jgi:shikimate dehydrogenase
MIELNKDTTVCASFSARPSNFGTKFHNFIYSELGLNYVYKGFAVEDIRGAVSGLKALGFRGAAVSMPHKEAVIPLLNELDTTAQAIGAVNTIVNTRGHLKGYNTDYIAVRELLRPYREMKKVALIGAGGMAKAIAAAMRELGFRDVTIIARSEESGTKLKGASAWKYQSRFQGDESFALLINATPQGMAPDTESLPCPSELVKRAEVLFDSVAFPSETKFIQMGRKEKKAVVTGLQIISLQAVEQFELYTGVRPTDELVRRAAEHARV